MVALYPVLSASGFKEDWRDGRMKYLYRVAFTKLVGCSTEAILAAADVQRACLRFAPVCGVPRSRVAVRLAVTAALASGPKVDMSEKHIQRATTG